MKNLLAILFEFVACALLCMMELSLKSKTIKKKHKKKKLQVFDSDIKPLIKPEAFDGVSNWIRMQEVLGKVKDEKKGQSEDKAMWIKQSGIKQSAKNFKAPFIHKENNQSINSNHESPELDKKRNVIEKKSYAKAVSFNIVSNGNTSTELHTDKVFKKDQDEEFKFNFDNSETMEVTKNSDCGKISKESSIHIDKKLTKAIAMDCEMVGTGPTGEDSIIARVSIVNSLGDCLYDEFVIPKVKVTDFRTKISGIRPYDLKKGKDLFQVQKDVLQIIEGRILVGHSLKHDLDVLFISHPKQFIRDTAYYKPFRDLCGGRTPSLKKLTSLVLGVEIQSGEHSSVEDAQAAMLLYLRQRHEWETFVKCQRKRKPKINNDHLTT